jgi:hypothetical protein
MCRFSGNITYFIAKTLPFTDSAVSMLEFPDPGAYKG